MKKKSQAAMEFLMIWGWAIMVAILVIGLLAYFGVFSPGTFIENQFIIYHEECNKNAEYDVYIIPEGLNYNEKRGFISDFKEALRDKFGKIHCPDFYSNLDILGCYYVDTNCEGFKVNRIKMRGGWYQKRGNLDEDWLIDNCKEHGEYTCSKNQGNYCWQSKYLCNNKYYVGVL